IGAEEPVRAVEGYGDNLDTHRFDHCANLGGAREQRPAELRVWQVVAGKPEVVQPLVALIESEDHLPSRDTLELAQTRGRVLPVMNGERRERSIEALIGERERLGNCLHYRRGIDGPLIDHDRRWFDRDYLAIEPSPGMIDQRAVDAARSEEHTAELQSRGHLACRLLREKKKATLGGFD